MDDEATPQACIQVFAVKPEVVSAFPVPLIWKRMGSPTMSPRPAKIILLVDALLFTQIKGTSEVIFVALNQHAIVNGTLLTTADGRLKN
jgi:hypothetical protein